jgi:hypothetical protein
VPPRYPPYEFSFAALAILLGVVWLTAVPAPAAIVAVLPAWTVVVLSAVLMASGILTIVGCVWWGNPERGLQLESGSLGARVGVLLILSGSLYLAWVGGAVATPPAFGVGLLIAWMGADIGRAAEIWRLVRKARKLAPIEPQ